MKVIAEKAKNACHFADLYIQSLLNTGLFFLGHVRHSAEWFHLFRIP